jgi:hypothetical protein
MNKKNAIVALVFFVPVVFAFAQQSDYFQIENVKNTITITGYSGRETDIKIPETIGEYPVTIIGEFAFTGLTGVTIPYGIVSIEAGAFTNNRLTYVVIPDSVTSIGPIAFQANRLEEVILPPDLLYIGQMVFASNRLKNVVIQDKVTRIMNGAFIENNLTEIYIPDSVTRIDSGAFTDNPLVKIRIGANVDFSESAFEEAFYQFYRDNGSKAGTYVKNGDTWVFSN